MKMYDLKGKVGIITGAGLGAGRAIAIRLATEGANVIVNDINLSNAEKVAEEIRAKGNRAIPIKADVSKGEDVAQMMEKAINAFGRIDILVNNAGICIVGPFLETDEADWDTTFAVNVRGQYLCTKAAIPHMIKQGGGKIINIASIVGKMGADHFVIYCASKHAVIGFTRALAAEMAKHLAPEIKITVNAVCPGTMTETGMRKSVDEQLAKSGITAQNLAPLGRMVYPDDVANVVAFLASRESDFVTGKAITVDGGETSSD
jgi:NAD(P)-dependent dehydrogenase (short-subunit alcohol dehydrogenase family)